MKIDTSLFKKLKMARNRTVPEFKLLRLWSFHFARRTSVIPMGAYKISIANLDMQTMQNSAFSQTGTNLGKCQQKTRCSEESIIVLMTYHVQRESRDTKSDSFTLI